MATLESALPDGSDDPRVATLRTLAAFIGRIEPGSPQLAAQISAYVDNVVTGNEPKLVQLLTRAAGGRNAGRTAAAAPERRRPAERPRKRRPCRPTAAGARAGADRRTRRGVDASI